MSPDKGRVEVKIVGTYCRRMMNAMIDHMEYT
jgi:hypothetical protein